MDLTAYGLVADRVTRVPGGYTADCYRVACGADDYLVKVWRLGSPDRASALGLLGMLQDNGLPVVPPILTRAGAATATTDAGEIAVFPYIDGVVPPDWPAWPDDVLSRLGAVLADVHRVDVSSVASLPRDRLEPLAAWPVASYPPLDTYADEVAAQLHRLAAIRSGSFRPVLCHTDFAGDNLLVTDDGIVVLDWDEAVTGPAEVDIMLFVTPDARPFARMLDGYRAAGGEVSALSLRRLEFCMLRRYLGDASVRVERISDPSATDIARAAAFADFEMWGVRMWRHLDAGLEAVAPMLGR
jgi:Ser/Thr protein kinase RdoA (MazF antagonist)